MNTNKILNKTISFFEKKCIQKEINDVKMILVYK